MAVQVMVTTSLESEISWITGADATVTAKDFVSCNGGKPLSVTRTVRLVVVFASAPGGCHVNTPVTGSTAAPAGAPGSRLYVSVFAGISASVAELVIVSVIPA